MENLLVFALHPLTPNVSYTRVFVFSLPCHPSLAAVLHCVVSTY